MIIRRPRKARTYNQRAQSNPVCPVDWRWQTAGRIARKEAWSTNEDDPALQAAIRLRRRIEQQNPYKRPSKAIQAILEALRVYEEDALLRWEVEARLVVGQSDDEISTRTRLAPIVIHAYEQVFFNVRNCLHAHGYLRGQLFGDRLLAGFGIGDVRQFWAWVGMSRQPRLIDHFIGVFRQVSRSHEPPSLAAYLRDNVPLQTQAFVAEAMLSANYPVASMLGHEQGSVEALTIPFRRQALPDHILERIVECARAHLNGHPVPELSRPRGRKTKQLSHAKAARPPQKIRDIPRTPK